MNILDLLYQDEIWEDAHGVEYLIADMEPRYCRNVANWLVRRADEIANADSLAMLRMAMPSAPIALAEVEAGMGEDFALKAHDPVEWLRQTDLLVALEARAGEAP